MHTCPACGRKTISGMLRCDCGADLSLLAMLDATVDGWFNRGLAAANNNSAAEALEWFSACCVARPTDAPARIAQAKCWARLGRFDEALVALDKAAALEPDNGEPELLARAIRQAMEENGTGPGREFSEENAGKTVRSNRIVNTKE